MPWLLRQIIKGRWYGPPEGPGSYQWVPEGEVQADVLGDFRTEQGTLSVWEIDEGCNNLEAVITALSSSRSNLQNLDYVLVEQEIVAGLGIKIEGIPGDTPYEAANQAWHRDLRHLTATHVARLAFSCLRTGTSARVPRKHIARLLAEAVQAKKLELSLMHENLRREIGIP